MASAPKSFLALVEPFREAVRAEVVPEHYLLMPAKRLAQPGTYKGDDSPIAEAGIVLVRLPAKTPYGMVIAEQ